MSIIVAYLFLSIAIVTEVIGTIYLRDTEGFTRLTPSVITAAAVITLGVRRVNPSVSRKYIVPITSVTIAIDKNK